MIWLCVVLVIAALTAALWYVSHRAILPRPPAASIDKINADFDAKKKAESQRIAGETHEDLLRDLNDRS
jgi:hypothetical protein